ncbi:MAG: hypothetical protein IBX72_06220 [Nitrospirae bacterium]|nr:hypothetical protein [Nitrospirota bacterium]
MKLKILSVDFPVEGKGIENYSFYEAPAFSDYDVVIIDPQNISGLWNKIKPERDGSLHTYTSQDGGFGKRLTSSMSRKKDELRSLLKITEGIVVCILRNQGHKLKLYEGYNSWTIDRYSWLPIGFRPISRQGKEIKIINKHHPFNQYLNAFKDSLYFEAVLERYREMLPIATNKVGELIAVEYPIDQGRLIFLPSLNNPDSEKVGGVLIDSLKGSFKWNIPDDKPAWLSTYSLHGEDKIIAEIKEIDDEISKIEKRKEELESEHNRLELLKSLLYEQGKYSLEPAVREAFKILGFNVLEPDEYDEEYDLFSKEEDLIVIGEIEGSEKQVDIAKYRQLLDYVDREETSNASKVKGVLIGNGFIKIKPEERDEQFTEAAIRGCRARKFCRITTYELYKAVQAVLSGTIRKEEIKGQILNCEDEFKLTILESKEVFCDN